MRKPQLSIIIPVYNTANFLKDTIQSILNQSYSDYEVILVDDGSTDNSYSVCVKLASADNRIKAFHKENSGVSSTRNFGFLHANGEYVYFMDSDDILHPQFLEIMMDEIVTHNLDMVCCEYTTFTAKPTFDHYCNWDVKDLSSEDSDIFHELTLAAHATSVWSKVLKSTLLHTYEIRFCDGMSFGEDMFVAWKCCLASKKAHFVKLPLYYYRQSGRGAVTRYHSNLYESYRAAFNDITEFAKKFQLYSVDFDKRYTMYFAQRLYSFVRMEVKAPYNWATKRRRLAHILHDKDMQKGLTLVSDNNALYQLARDNNLNGLLWYVWEKEKIAQIKNIIRMVFSFLK